MRKGTRRHVHVLLYHGSRDRSSWAFSPYHSTVREVYAHELHFVLPKYIYIYSETEQQYELTLLAKISAGIVNPRQTHPPHKMQMMVIMRDSM